MRLEQNRVDCVQTELRTKLRKKQNRTNKYIPSLFLIAPAIFFSQFAWPRVKFIWGWVDWFGPHGLNPMSVPEFLHVYGLGWPYWRPYVPETLDALTPTSNNLANHSSIN